MDDLELLQIVTFKLHEATKRMVTLASEANSPELREALLLIADRVGSLEQQARESMFAALCHALAS